MCIKQTFYVNPEYETLAIIIQSASSETFMHMLSLHSYFAANFKSLAWKL